MSVKDIGIMVGVSALLVLLVMTPIMAVEVDTVPKVKTTVTTVVEVIPETSGQVDWTTGEISAKGIGVPPDGVDSVKARIMAREAAIVVAERNLVKIVHGIRINSVTTVQDAAIKSDEIKRRVEGFIKGAVVVEEHELNDGSYEVTMALRMYGKHESLAKSIDLDKWAAEKSEPVKVVEESHADIESEIEPEDETASISTTDAPFTSDTPEQPVEQVNPVSEIIGNPFTGLLIDCRGIGICRSMSPKILDDNSQEVWGTVKVSPELVIEKGIVSYYKSVEQSKSSGRVGSNPLIIKAIGKSGPKMFPSNPIITQADAARIIAEDVRCGFLNRLAVGFIVD